MKFSQFKENLQYRFAFKPRFLAEQDAFRAGRDAARTSGRTYVNPRNIKVPDEHKAKSKEYVDGFLHQVSVNNGLMS